MEGSVKQALNRALGTLVVSSLALAGSLGADAGVAPAVAVASSSGWASMTRLGTSAAPLALGAFSQPNGSFVVSGYSRKVGTRRSAVTRPE
jgi:hypothetical protein